MNTLKYFALLIFFSSQSLALEKVYEAHDNMLYVSLNKGSALIIDGQWSYGNKGGHGVTSTLRHEGKVLYSSASKIGQTTYVSVQGIPYHIPNPGLYVFRISLQAKGGEPSLQNPYIKVRVLDA